MPDLPAVSQFTALLTELRFPAAAAVALIAGVVRGFSGFGSALIYMPLIASIYDPRTAAVTIILIDLVSSAPFTVPELRRCIWNEVMTIWTVSLIGIPLGVWALLVLDPVPLRWFIAAFVLSALAVLVLGWRYRKAPGFTFTAAVGLASGFGGGAVGIAAPPVIIYWLSRNVGAVTMRANMMVYLALMDITVIALYSYKGLFDVRMAALSILLGLPFIAGVAAGTLWFKGTSDLVYRRAAYLIIALAALVSLPVLDPLLQRSAAP